MVLHISIRFRAWFQTSCQGVLLCLWHVWLQIYFQENHVILKSTWWISWWFSWSFHSFCFEFSKDDTEWNLLKEKFKFHMHISMNLHKYEPFKILPMHLEYRASKLVTNKVVVPSDSLYSSYLRAPFPQVEVGELKSLPANLPPYSPTPHTHNFSTSLDCESDVYDDVLSPCPPSI